MGVIIYRNLTYSKIEAMMLQLNNLSDSIRVAEARLTEFVGDDTLDGVAWSATKSYAEELLIPVLRTLRLWCEYQLEGCDAYNSAILILPIVDCLDEDSLNEEYNYWCFWKNSLENSLLVMTGTIYTTAIATCVTMINTIQYKLCAIEQFKNSTSNCFDIPRCMKNDLMAIGIYLSTAEPSLSSNFSVNAIDSEWLVRIQAYSNYREKIDRINAIYNSMLLGIELCDETGKPSYTTFINSLLSCPDTLAVWINLFQRMHLEDLNQFDLSDEEIIAISMIADRFDDIPMIQFNVSNTLESFVDRYAPYYMHFIRSIWSDTIDELYNYASDNLSLGSEISRLSGFEYAGDDGDYYYTQRGSIQNRFGFMDFYDEFGRLLGMDLEEEVITFNCNNREYRIELWRGIYGFGGAFGGEFGIYYRDASEAIANPYLNNIENQFKAPQNRYSLYHCLDEDEQFRVIQRIIDPNTNTTLIDNDTNRYSNGESGRHYWNLAIRTQDRVNDPDLIHVYSLYITDDEIRSRAYESLYQSLNSNSSFLVEELTDDIGNPYIQILWR